jgi:GH25 family lysozyme M1 (1,4-beta-N-acetylmuramidase)
MSLRYAARHAAARKAMAASGTLHMPDVSEFQGMPNWKAVRGHNGGAAIIRAAYGTGYTDISWSRGNRQAAEDGGISALGFYQYVRAGQNVVDQADYFCGLVGKLVPGQFAVMDLEEGSGDQSGRARSWLAFVDKALGYPGYYGGWLYSGLYFAGATGLLPVMAQHRSWVAAYQGTPPAGAGTLFNLWQHTNGTIAPCSNQPWPGIGRCDCSIFAGSLAQFTGQIYRAAPAPPPPAPPVPQPSYTEDSMYVYDMASGAVALPVPAKKTKIMLYCDAGAAGGPQMRVGWEPGWNGPHVAKPSWGAPAVLTLSATAREVTVSRIAGSGAQPVAIDFA